jgi:phosphatidylserine decarboxylase
MSGPGQARPRAALGARLCTRLQYALPQHGLSRIVHGLARARSVPLKNWLIRGFVRGYRPDLSDAVGPDPLGYATFNEFFTRALRPGARPIAAEQGAIVAPADGTVSAAGRIEGDRLLQAKGMGYSLDALLAGQSAWSATFRDGNFVTIYLAPHNYHRVHLPLAGVLREGWYVPGRLFSVNRTTVDAVPGLFARNERLVLLFERGPLAFAVILVGALNVGSMSTVWHGEVTPRRPRRVTQLPRIDTRSPLALEAGAEIGRFNMGSTVIVLLPPRTASWESDLVPGRMVRMGELIGRRTSAP